MIKALVQLEISLGDKYFWQEYAVKPVPILIGQTRAVHHSTYTKNPHAMNRGANLFKACSHFQVMPS